MDRPAHINGSSAELGTNSSALEPGVFPEGYVSTSDGWNSSRTKVIDNALVGMLLEEGIASKRRADDCGVRELTRARETRDECVEN
jgi:hypothetical protein